MFGTYHPCIGNGAIERLPIARNESGGGDTITVEKQDPLPTGLARSKIASRCCSWPGTHEHTDRQIRPWCWWPNIQKDGGREVPNTFC